MGSEEKKKKDLIDTIRTHSSRQITFNKCCTSYQTGLQRIVSSVVQPTAVILTICKSSANEEYFFSAED